MSRMDDPNAIAARILVVDDDPIFAEIAASCLEGAGLSVRVAADGVEALELLDVEPFDLAVIDLSMPRIDGFRLIGLIRGARRWSHLAIVVVTAREDAAAVSEAMAVGANAYLSKPIAWDTLPDCLLGVLDKHGSRKLVRL